jgi:hypothetical protein
MATWAGQVIATGGLAISLLLAAGCSSERMQTSSTAFRPAFPSAARETEHSKPTADEVTVPAPSPQTIAEVSFQPDENAGAVDATASTVGIPPIPVCPGSQSEPLPVEGPVVWGTIGFRGYPVGQHVASNGVEFNQLFAADLNLNFWLCRQQGLYLFTESTFWGQKPGPGITNPTQGSFDFSKREFDLDAGLAWNFYGSLEARAFLYSFNNLNRGDSQTSPSGFNDGIGLENRYYLNQEYKNLGTATFDVARASFASVGYYPSKSMMDGQSHQFKPGPFMRGYFVQNIWGPQYYLYADVDFIADRSFTPTLMNLDVGLALRPFQSAPRLEFRVGTEDEIDLHNSDREYGVYLGIRYIY